MAPVPAAGIKISRTTDGKKWTCCQIKVWQQSILSNTSFGNWRVFPPGSSIFSVVVSILLFWQWGRWRNQHMFGTGGWKRKTYWPSFPAWRWCSFLWSWHLFLFNHRLLLFTGLSKHNLTNATMKGCVMLDWNAFVVMDHDCNLQKQCTHQLRVKLAKHVFLDRFFSSHPLTFDWHNP